MSGNVNEVSCNFGEFYKGLPLKMRIRVNMTAGKLLELQKENKAFSDDAEDPSFAEEAKAHHLKDVELNISEVKL